jgi:reverse gyrase
METANISATTNAMWNEILEKSKSIAIVGGRGSGKTAFGFFCSQFTKLPIYLFKYPSKDVLPENYNILYDFEEMVKIKDSFIWIDEPQLFIPIYEKKSNFEFMKLLSLMRQKDNILVTSTSDTRFYTRGLESYIDTWVVKDIDYDTIKQGSKISKIIKGNVVIHPEGFKLEKNEYLLDDRNFKKHCGKKTFELPSFWNERISKVFKEMV